VVLLCITYSVGMAVTGGRCLGVRKSLEAPHSFLTVFFMRSFHVPESPVLSVSNSSFLFMTEQLFAKVRGP